MTNRRTSLNLAIAAALGAAGVSTVANAVVIGTPAKIASEVTQADSKFSTDSISTSNANVKFDDINLGTVDNKNFSIKFSLGNGARFATGSTPTLVCSGSSGVFSGTKTLIDGGASATSVTYLLDANGLASQAAVSHCTLSVTGAGNTGGLQFNSGSNVNSVTMTVTGSYLIVGQTYGFSTAGAILTAVPAVAATAVAANTAVLDVASGYVGFLSANNSTISANGASKVWLGTVTFLSHTAARTLVSATITATDVATSATLTLGGTFVAGAANVTGAHFYLPNTAIAAANSATICSAGTEVTGTLATAAGTVSFALNKIRGDSSSGSLVSGLAVCFKTPGSTRLAAGTVTVSLSATNATGYTADTTLGNGSLAAVALNGATRTAYNITNAADQDISYIRIYNTSTLAGKIIGTIYGVDGTALCSGVTLVGSLAAGAVEVLDSSELATICGTSWSGRARMVIDGEISSMEVQALIRAGGVLTNNSDVTQ